MRPARIGATEVLRRPGRFAITAAVLALLVALQVVLWGLLDGLTGSTTGAYRALGADLLVYGPASRAALLRSQVSPELRARVEAADGVAAVGGLGVTLTWGRTDGAPVPTDLAVFGYERSTGRLPAPPPPGDGLADRSLSQEGVAIGDVLAVGPQGVPIRVSGWVQDASYLGQPGLWVAPATWRRVLATAAPDRVLPEGTWQALVVDAEGDAAAVAARSARATGAEALPLDEAISRLPGVEAQRASFLQLIGATTLVAGLVVALFFALITLERVRLFGVLKAVGVSSAQLLGALALQALTVTGAAYAVGVAAAVALARVAPEEVPIRLTGGRVLWVAPVLVGTALLGLATSLRRVVRIDPATAVVGR